MKCQEIREHRFQRGNVAAILQQTLIQSQPDTVSQTKTPRTLLRIVPNVDQQYRLDNGVAWTKPHQDEETQSMPHNANTDVPSLSWRYKESSFGCLCSQLRSERQNPSFRPTESRQNRAKPDRYRGHRTQHVNVAAIHVQSEPTTVSWMETLLKVVTVSNS